MARPKLPYRSPLEALPQSAKQVWIRRLPWYDKPVLATFDTTSRTFTTHPTIYPNDETLELPVPAALVHSWKFRYLADENETPTTNPLTDEAGNPLATEDGTPLESDS